jgi:hypothetical protein
MSKRDKRQAVALLINRAAIDPKELQPVGSYRFAIGCTRIRKAKTTSPAFSPIAGEHFSSPHQT